MHTEEYNSAKQKYADKIEASNTLKRLDNNPDFNNFLEYYTKEYVFENTLNLGLQTSEENKQLYIARIQAVGIFIDFLNKVKSEGITAVKDLQELEQLYINSN